MKLTVQMDRKDEIPLAEWEEFLANARRAGAADDTPVAEDYDEEDPRTPSGFVITVEQAEPRVSPENVVLPTDLVHDLIHVVTAVASSDGDVRGLEDTAKQALDHVNEYFRKPALGPNPWTSQDGE